MSNAAALPRHVVLADLVPGAITRDIALILTGAGLTGIAAQVSIHTSLSPVPFTLQTFAVLVIGASFGPMRGALSLATYAAAGVAGVPWFAQHSHGWGGPSFGYVLGFIAAAALAGALARRGADKNVVTTVGLMIAGSAVIYLIGTIWLARSLKVGAAEAFNLGVRPFLAIDALKIAFAALALPTAWKMVRR